MEHGHLHSQLPGRARPGPRPRSHRLSGLYANSSSPRAAHPPPASGPDPFGLVTPERGFLPVADPLRRLRGSAELEAWEEALYEVPKLSVATSGGLLRRKLAALPRFPLQEVLPPSDEGQAPSPQLWRAYSLLSFLSHAYVWCDEGPPPGTLPSTLAVPWARVASALGMPPVLCYCTYNLLNWRRLDAARPIELGNIVCLNNFLGGMDEEWFRLVHVDIEAKAATAVAAIAPAQQAAAQRDAGALVRQLAAMTVTLRAMQATLSRMGERCDPAIYYKRVRTPMSGWRANPALPDGLIYEGVSDQPMQLYGETGAQSSVLACLDAALGIEHDRSSWLRAYLDDMQLHMPPAHRAFISHVAAGPSIRRCCQELLAEPSSGGAGELRDAYNACIAELERFRAQHKGFANAYIARFSGAAAGAASGANAAGSDDSSLVGTGGSQFMPALRGYQATTAKHFL